MNKLKSNIIKHLLDKGNYEAEVDDYLIDTIIENIEYSIILKENLKQNGLIVTIPNGNGIATTKENPAFGTYKKCLDNINQSANRLGINRRDRISLKLLEEKVIDDFDKF